MKQGKGVFWIIGLVALSMVSFGCLSLARAHQPLPSGCDLSNPTTYLYTFDPAYKDAPIADLDEAVAQTFGGSTTTQMVKETHIERLLDLCTAVKLGCYLVAEVDPSCLLVDLSVAEEDRLADLIADAAPPDGPASDWRVFTKALVGASKAEVSLGRAWASIAETPLKIPPTEPRAAVS